MIDEGTFTREATVLLPVLHRIGMSILRAEADAQDAVQQGLLKAWDKRGQARPETLRAWMTRIIVNECRNIQRYRMRVVPTERVDEVGRYDPPDLALADAVAALPEKLRTPFLLKYMEGYSEKEVAQAMQVPVTTVKNRLLRARRQLQAQLSDTEVIFE